MKPRSQQKVDVERHGGSQNPETRTQPHPPRWARLLVERMTAVEDRPYVLSDLEEEFEKRSLENPATARRWYRAQAVRSAVAGLGGRRTWSRIEARQRDRRATAAARRSTTRPLSAGSWFGNLGRVLRWSLRMNSRKPLSTLVMSLSLFILSLSFFCVFDNRFMHEKGLEAAFPRPC